MKKKAATGTVAALLAKKAARKEGSQSIWPISGGALTPTPLKRPLVRFVPALVTSLLP